jgi:hypothetical protein
LALAFPCYVTNETIAGAAAASYGFLVSDYGAGTSTFDVRRSGVAFGVADGSRVAVLDLLVTTNSRSSNGVLYDLDGDRSTDDYDPGRERIVTRTLANDVYSAINESGHI